MKTHKVKSEQHTFIPNLKYSMFILCLRALSLSRGFLKHTFLTAEITDTLH